MKCLECDKELKSISNTHLLKCCGLTMKEYAIKHCIPIEMLFSDKKITKLSPEQMERANIKRMEAAKNKQIQMLTYEESQVVIGSLLGDGYLFRGQSQNSTYLILEQGITQLNYLWWKGMKLKRLGAKFYQYYKYNTVKNRYTTRNQIRTKSLYIFGNLIPYFYNVNGKGKYVNPEILEYVDPLALAIWFMDDGNHQEGLSWGALATQSFSKSDNDILCDFFKTKYNIKSRVAKDSKDMYYIFFDKNAFKTLKEVIEPHMFYKMKYKIDGKHLPECVLSKRVIFDSSHFLDEYNGKCSNLHGGRYELWVSVKGPVDPRTGMVLDYGYMKTILDKYIVETFDHHCINYAVKELGWRSTTELISMYIWKVLIEFFPNLYKIELYETEGSKCEYIGPSLNEMKHDKTLELLNMFKEKDISWRERIITNFSEMFSNIDEETEDIDVEVYADDTKTTFKLVKLNELLEKIEGTTQSGGL